MMIPIVDARSLGGFPTKKKDGKVVRYAYRDRRSIHGIDSIGWHHWGAHVDIRPRSGETYEDAATRRARRTTYHITIFSDLVVLAWPFDLVTWHGGALNKRSIGVAIAGRFSALERDRSEIHDDPLDFCAAIEATMRLLRSEVPSLRYNLTHSQVSAKPADPGELTARIVTHVGKLLKPSIVSLPSYCAGSGSAWAPEWCEA